MKREIKFRVWDKGRNVMFDVEQLAFGRNGDLLSIYCDGPDFSNDPDVLMGEKPDLDKAVLMQYTGRKDKNGKESYVGDIVKFGSVWTNGDDEDPHEEIHVGVIEFDPDNAVYIVNCEKSGDGHFLLCDVVRFDAYGVIGNIFENPELLEAHDETRD